MAKIRKCKPAGYSTLPFYISAMTSELEWDAEVSENTSDISLTQTSATPSVDDLPKKVDGICDTLQALKMNRCIICRGIH